MADIGVLPRLAGQGWSVSKTPVWQTRIQRAVSGRELRLLDYPYPLWQFQLTWEALGDNSGQAGVSAIGSLLATDLRTLLGFFMACQGAFAAFLYDDPTDDNVTGQGLGTADGISTTAQLVRTMGPAGAPNFTEPIAAPDVVSAIYFNGITQPASSYSVDPTSGIVTFSSPPPANVAITADFSYYFRCRFISDAYSFENFMYRLWSLKKLDFISVRS
jgi:uncharacterized protein (TIGR02217 family)